MPELILRKIHNRFDMSQKASIAYGNQSIEDKSPGGYPSTGAWNGLLQKFSAGAHYRDTSAVNQEEQDKVISDWSENKDPLTQVDLLDIEEDQVQELILRIKTSISITYRENLANRLLALFNDAKEEDPASLGIATGSLRNLYYFLYSHTNLKCPIISLTPDYNIYASWRGEKRRVFSVHFLPNGDTRFVIFKPNDRHPKKPIRISGSATTDILMETVAPYNVLNWILE